MPSLFRFLIVLVVLSIIGGAAIIYLAVFVGPHTREMTVRVPAEKLQVQGPPPTPDAQAQPQSPPVPAAKAQPQSPPAQQ